jgi:hypothetical protein
MTGASEEDEGAACFSDESRTKGMAQRLERDIITLVRLAFVLVRVGIKKVH